MSEVLRIGTNQAVYDDPVRAAREELQSYSRSTILERTDAAKALVKVNDEYMLLGVVKPKGDYDENHPLVMGLPFGKTLTPHMILRAMMLQRSVDDGTRPVILLPNNTSASHAYSLSADERRRMEEQKSFAPLADKQAAAIEAYVGPGAQFDLITYSQAAAIAPHIARRIPTGVMVSADAPNTQPGRPPKQLKKDFIGQGMQALYDLNNAVLDADIDSLRLFLGVRKNGKSNPRQIMSMVAELRTSLLHDNKTLHIAMSGDSHARDVQGAMVENPDMRAVIARAIKSLIFTEEDFQRIQTQVPNATFAVLEGYGHEAADNITQFAQFGRTALSHAQRS